MKNSDFEKQYEKEIKALQDLQHDVAAEPPDIGELRALVRDVKAKKSRAERLSSLLFAGFAAVFLAGLCFVFFTFSSAFAIIQVCSLIPLPFVIIRAGKKVEKT